MMKFRVELWRVVSFLLITTASTLPFAAIYLFANDAVLQPQTYAYEFATGSLYFCAGLCMLLQTLLHRRFTFRATEKWYIAAPVMVLLALLWTYMLFASDSVDPDCARLYSSSELCTFSCWMTLAWLPLSYLLQRCVIYCHTTDTNCLAQRRRTR